MPALAAPAAQSPAMAGQSLAACFLEFKAEAVGSSSTVAESLRTAQATIDSAFVVAGRIDELLPGNHVVQRRADAGIAHPVDAIDGRQEAAHRIALIANAFIEQRGIGNKFCGLHARRLENAFRQKFDKLPACMLFDQISQNAEIAVAVGIMRARCKMRGLQAAQQALCLFGQKDAFRIGPAQNRQRPVIAQARLVVAQIAHAGTLFSKLVEIGGKRIIKNFRLADTVEQNGAGELLADRTDRHARFGRHRLASGKIGKAPCMAQHDLAIFQHRDRTTRSLIVLRNGANEGFKRGKIEF